MNVSCRRVVGWNVRFNFCHRKITGGSASWWLDKKDMHCYHISAVRTTYYFHSGSYNTNKEYDQIPGAQNVTFILHDSNEYARFHTSRWLQEKMEKLAYFGPQLLEFCISEWCIYPQVLLVHVEVRHELLFTLGEMLNHAPWVRLISQVYIDLPAWYWIIILRDIRDCSKNDQICHPKSYDETESI